MVSLTSLWAPILLSAALVFVASSISHEVVRFHRSDYAKLPGEDDVMDLLRRLAVSPGDYFFPLPAGRTDSKDPGFREKWKRGPAGLVTVLPNGGHPLGRTLALWFLYCVASGVFAAFIAGRGLVPGASGRNVFLLAGAAAFGGHALALWPAAIWYGRSWTSTIKSTVDGFVYGLLAGGAFAWLWPR